MLTLIKKQWFNSINLYLADSDPNESIKYDSESIV
jgi:hypothetical protein